MASSSSSPFLLPSSAAAAITRRTLLLSSSAATSLSLPQQPDTTITDRVFLDFSLCPNFFRPDRTLGDSQLPLSALCSPDQEFDQDITDNDTNNINNSSYLLGRVVLGLFGRLAPTTASNFKTLCSSSPSSSSSSSSYRNTLVHKVFPGRFLMAGRQGDKPGEVRLGRNGLSLPRNVEAVDPKCFVLTHSRPGLLSLCLSENDDPDDVRLDPEYRNVEFVITTGPGPCPELDNKNIVFGSVLEGLDVVRAIAAVPTYRPAEKIRQFNGLAEFLGDERAQNARASWNRPLKTIYISNCGEFQVAKPSLAPSLP